MRVNKIIATNVFNTEKITIKKIEAEIVLKIIRKSKATTENGK